MKNQFRQLSVILFAFFSLFSNAICQSSEGFPGYVILQNQDTIKGLVLYEDKTSNPVEVILKKDGSEKSYSPDQISGFGANGKSYYHSGKLKYSTNPYKSEDLLNSPEVLWEEKIVFLKVQIIGEVDYYEYVDKDNKPHFVVRNAENELVDLLNIKYKEGFNALSIPRYKNQLKRIMQSCPSLYDKIDKLKFNGSSIKSIVKDYHDCNNAGADFIAEKERVGLQVTLNGGLSSVRHSFDTKVTKKGAKSVAGEILFEHIFPRNNRVWSLLTGIGYRGYDAPLTAYGKGDVRLDYLRFNIGPKRVLINKNYQVHANAGIAYSFLLTEKLPGMRTTEQGLFFGIGGAYDRFRLNARYEISNGYSARVENTKIETVFLTLGYVLFER